MRLLDKFKVRTDSKSIALLTIFSSMVLALELFPIVGLTDLKIPGIPFTIDVTGIPIFIIFMGLGVVYSMMSIGVMFVAIGYRNFQGAVFKGFAEVYKILGVAIAWFFLRNRRVSIWTRLIVYTVFATIFCTIGMFLTNIGLFQIFYGSTVEGATAFSAVFIPWNILQSIINIAYGGFLYILIPEDLKLQTGLGDQVPDEVLELTDVEIEADAIRNGS